MKKKIGILAGMGPRSTAPFIELLIDECQQQYGAKYDQDFPEMHIISLPTPFRPGEEIDRSQMLYALQQGILSLVAAHVSVIVVPCNLAHGYFDEMQALCPSIPLLHIADSALQQLPRQPGNLTILATEPTLQAGFYQQRLQSADHQVLLFDEIAKLTNTLLLVIKHQGFAEPSVDLYWQMLVDFAQQQKIQTLIVACTDLTPLLQKTRHSSLTFIDTSASLAKATIAYYRVLLRDADIN